MGSNQSAKHFTLLENVPLPCLRGTMKFFWFGLFLVSFAGEQPTLPDRWNPPHPNIRTIKKKHLRKTHGKTRKGGSHKPNLSFSRCVFGEQSDGSPWQSMVRNQAERYRHFAGGDLVVWLLSTPHIVTLRGCSHALPSFLSFLSGAGGLRLSIVSIVSSYMGT